MDIDLTDHYAQRKETCRELFYLAKKTHNGFQNQKSIVKKTMRLWFDLPSPVLNELFNIVTEEEYGIK